MTIPRSTAKKLCTDTEYRLVNESFSPDVGALTEKGLAQRIRRARTARDKYRSLAQRQTREARGRISPRGARAAAGNKNTVAKQQLFDETLARYEKQAQRASKTQAATRSTAAAGKKAASSVKKAGANAAKKATKATKATKKVSAKAGKKSSAASPAKPAGTAGKAKKTASKSAASKSVSAKSAARKSATTKSTASKSAANKPDAKESSAIKSAGSKSAAAKKSGTKSAGKGAAQAETRAASKPASKTVSKQASKAAVQPEPHQTTTKAAGKKKTRRTPASRAGTITKPVKIPLLAQVVAAVSNVVAARKEEAQNAVPAPPSRSPKAPAQTNDGAPPGVVAVPAAGVNPKGPEFPRNAHERGRVGAAVKRQQARRDTR